jgi:hypothetical protein
MVSGFGSTVSPSQAYANQQTESTYSNTASRRIRNHSENDSDSDSIIELTDAAGHISGRTPSAACSTKAYALENTSARNSRTDTHGGIHIHNEVVVDYENA